MVEVGPVFHLFRRDDTGIAFSSNMGNFYEVILNPFADSIVPKFQVAHIFYGGSVDPVHSGFVILVDKGSLRIVGKGSDSKGEANREVENCDCDTSAFAG